jgi:cyclic pyranopterin phosphate synthase
MTRDTPGSPSRLRDAHGRRVTYLRLSVTDRCNLHCAYCRPASPCGPVVTEPPRPRAELLSFEEIERVVRAAAELGVVKVRLTGGEPLLRRGIGALCGRLARVPGIRTVALTTNGVLLETHLDALRRAGVGRLNVSLDTLDRERFRRLTGVDALPQVLRGLERAVQAGFAAVKLNCVLQRGINDDALPALVDFAAARDLDIRFIEAMPLPGTPHGRIFLPAAEARARLAARHDLVPLRAPGAEAAGPASEFRIAGSVARVGFIAALGDSFCRRCNRLRLLADGRLKPCLFAPAAVRLLPLLRRDPPDAVLARALVHAVRRKPAAHPFLPGPGLLGGRRGSGQDDRRGDPMVEIGG